MSDTWVSQLTELGDQLRRHIHEFDEKGYTSEIERLGRVSREVAGTWSGSSLGYHSRVYYRNLQPPPPGAHFSREWGFHNAVFGATSGHWDEMDPIQVKAAIIQRADASRLDEIETLSSQLRNELKRVQDEADGILNAFLAFKDDEYIRKIIERITGEDPLTISDATKAQLPSGQMMTRDPVAAGQGLWSAPHQDLLAEAVGLQAPVKSCEKVADALGLAARHIARLASRPAVAGLRQQGTNIFIGHGRSMAWRDLKDFIQDRLSLPWDEFNRVAVAGVTNIERLVKMLDDAGMAFLVLTAEDERTDGALTARQNVVHEVGLFQGRLGFSKAIVMIEEGCEPFSNIEGLGQIRFPAGNISAKFEDVRLVLEREGFLE